MDSNLTQKVVCGFELNSKTIFLNQTQKVLFVGFNLIQKQDFGVRLVICGLEEINEHKNRIKSSF